MNITLITCITVQTPFSNFGMNAVEKLFTDDDVKEIIELTKRLVA